MYTAEQMEKSGEHHDRMQAIMHKIAITFVMPIAFLLWIMLRARRHRHGYHGRCHHGDQRMGAGCVAAPDSTVRTTRVLVGVENLRGDHARRRTRWRSDPHLGGYDVAKKLIYRSRVKEGPVEGSALSI